MKIRKIYLGLFTLLLLIACSTTQYQKKEDGIIINLKQRQESEARRVRLRVLGNELTHVSSTPEQDFPKDSSLIVIPGIQTVPFTTEDTGDSIVSVSKDKPQPFQYNAEGQHVSYNGSQRTIKL